ncbi:hypothetical protein ACLESD_11375 [Pyxidicoccus sp. 3LFB2]
MNKFVMGSLAALAMLSVGCGGSEMDVEGDATALPGDETGTAEQGISGRHCVDQSYASAMRTDDFIFMCNDGPNWSTQLSRNHPLNILSDCGTYVWGRSQWTGIYYWVRKGALRAC